MLDRIFKFLSSFWLTVVLLGFALVLVFAGTMAQVKIGLYNAQAEYFRSLFVYWKPEGAAWRLPIFPGGWLLGALLLVNLIAAHLKRFGFSKNKAGIWLIHAGLIFLLAGQFFTELLQVESTMRMKEGETKNYAEDSRRNELVVINTSKPDADEVVSIPESVLAAKGTIQHPNLPFTINVREYFGNSTPVGPMQGDTNKIKARDGLGSRLCFAPASETTVMDDDNKPAALIEIADASGLVGDWAVSTWLTRYPHVENLRSSVGNMLGKELDLPQAFSYKGSTYEIALRPVRYYKPYSLTLLDFRHDVYKGTDIPKNFSSKVHLSDPTKHEERDVLIYMNNPLRYGGETFYQSGYLPGDAGTILQVVNNPAAMTPYVSSTLISMGMIVQFVMHLVNFRNRRKQAGSPAVDSAVTASSGMSSTGSAVAPVNGDPTATSIVSERRSA